MSTEDRDELIVELLSRIIGRLDAIEDGMAKAEEAGPKNSNILRPMATVLRGLHDHMASVAAETRSPEQNDDAIRAIVERATRDSLAPALRHRNTEVDRLERINRTWLWAAPALALAALVVFVLLARLALNTVIGCTVLGGKYALGRPGYVDTCVFVAGGWW